MFMEDKYLKLLLSVPFHGRIPRINKKKKKTSQKYVTQQELFQNSNALALVRREGSRGLI